MKTVLNFLAAIIVFAVIGFVAPYVIQFKFHMFGANMVRIGDIVQLWVLCLFFGAVGGIYFLLRAAD